MPAVSAQLNDFIMPGVTRQLRPRSGERTWFSRFAAAFEQARTRQAEREIARLIAFQGGRLTDSLERDIERHFI
jgi:hypothetical protein